MRLLVTGGAGFIGSNFVPYILEDSEHSVVTVDSLTYAGEKSNLDTVRDHPDHEFVKGDIRERDLVSDLLEDCDGIVNFAAQTHVDRSIEGAGPFVQTNVPELKRYSKQHLTPTSSVSSRYLRTKYTERLKTVPSLKQTKSHHGTRTPRRKRAPTCWG